MTTKENDPPFEISEDGYPIEIYTDERIEEFLAESKLTAEEKKRLEKKLKRLKPKISD